MLHPDDVGYLEKHLDLLYNKYKLVHQLQPASICEIGVRTGYSMRMFIEATVDHTEILGIDNASDEHGGFHGACLHAVRQLGIGRWSLWIIDSHKIERTYKKFDFWHIDGDHTRIGTYQDLELARRCGAKCMLVDDYGRIPETKSGTDWFIESCDVLFSIQAIDEFQVLLTRRDKDED